MRTLVSLTLLLPEPRKQAVTSVSTASTFTETSAMKGFTCESYAAAFALTSMRYTTEHALADGFRTLSWSEIRSTSKCSFFGHSVASETDSYFIVDILSPFY